jgi:hypothetical protein
MRQNQTKWKPVGWIARGLGIILGLGGIFCATRAANPATEPSGAVAPKPAPKKIPESVMRLFAGLVKEASLSGPDLSRWRPTKQNDQVPSPKIRSLSVDLPGEWRVCQGGFSGSSLVISCSGPNGYNVTLTTYGCMGQWKLHRTGRYAGGVLVLDGPIKQYCCSAPYQRLYAVHIGELDFLVPDAGVGEFQKAIGLDGKPFVRDMDAYLLGFTRGPLSAPAAPEAQRESRSPSLRGNLNQP